MVNGVARPESISITVAVGAGLSNGVGTLR